MKGKFLVGVFVLLAFSSRLNAIGVTIRDGATFELRDGTSETSLKLPAGSILEVGSDGTFKANGGTVTRSEAGTYQFVIYPDGTIDVQNTKFEYMGVNGIHIWDGASIAASKLANCEFTSGTAGEPLLRIECGGGPFVFPGIKFMVGGKSKAAGYNVKTTAGGSGDVDDYYHFDNCEPTSDFAGDQYDWDPGDDDWTGSPGNEPWSDGWITWGPPFATELISFDAQAGWEQVLLHWVSEVEINTQKYRLERSLKEDSEFEQIEEMPAKGVGGTYSYLDKGVVPGMSYWYKLIAVEADLSYETWGPVKATPKRCKLIPFTLSQNVPNPFNKETLIEFSVPGKRPSKQKLPILLRVYDLSGRRVCELINGEYSPGWYSVRWEPERKARGIYFYRLEVGEKSLSKKLVVY